MAHRTGPWDTGHRTCQGHAIGHRTLGHTSGHGPWALAPKSPGPTCGPWACPVSYGMPYGVSSVLCPSPCPLFHGPVLCPMALSCVLWPCPLAHGSVLCPMGLSCGPPQNFTSVVRCPLRPGSGLGPLRWGTPSPCWRVCGPEPRQYFALGPRQYFALTTRAPVGPAQRARALWPNAKGSGPFGWAHKPAAPLQLKGPRPFSAHCSVA